MNFLYAAFVATWVIHIGYLTHLLRRYARLKAEVEHQKKQ